MKIPGKVQNGVVVLEPGPVLPDGTEVTVSCPDVSPDTKGEEWTEERNRRRLDLIDKEIAETITPDEAEELARLQAKVEENIDKTHPLPFDMPRELREKVSST